MDEIQASTPLSHHGNPLLRILALLFFALLIAAVSSLVTYYFIGKQVQVQPQSSLQPTAKAVPTDFPTTTGTIPTPTLYPTSNDPNEVRFTSEKLGITFTYLKTQDKSFPNSTIEATETGNRVYVGGKDGQWVEVFEKSPNDSFEEAIRKRLLANYSPADCFVVKSKLNNFTYPSSFEQAYISFPKTNQENDPFSESTASKCPAEYRETNGIRYFLQDNNHPSKFLFFSIGQYGITSGSDKGWQQTVQILK